jgi:NADH-quinone oxidoreductase subunit C
MSYPPRPPVPHEAIAATLQELIERSWDSFGMQVLDVSVSHLMPLVQRLREDFGFTLFLDVTAVHYAGQEQCFDVVYHFLCPAPMTRIRVKVRVPESDPTVPTLTGLYGSARYMERETHDMYGIHFAGNDDLRPILLYEGFVGHPLRKDYPMEQEQPIVPYRK